MTGTSGTDPVADAPLDAVDDEILAGLADLYGRLDPPPADLDTRVTFAIGLERVDIEVARLGADLAAGDLAAGDLAVGDLAVGDLAAGDLAAGDLVAGDRAGEDLVGAGTVGAGTVGAGTVGAAGVRAAGHGRTLTFVAGSMEIMVTVVAGTGGVLRLDGWLAPPGPHRVVLRQPGAVAPRTVTADAAGRFVLDRVPPGVAQLVVEPAGGGTGAPVVTPTWRL